MIIELGDDQASLFAWIDDDVVDLIKAAHIPFTKLAKALGLSRPYFHRIFANRRIRLEYLIELQNKLNIEIVTQADIDGGIMLINDAAEERYVLH
jgi:hypothetical protein